MNCVTCQHWNLRESPMRKVGFGLCNVEANEMFRKAKTTSGQNVCRIGKHAEAPTTTVDRRQTELEKV